MPVSNVIDEKDDLSLPDARERVWKENLQLKLGRISG